MTELIDFFVINWEGIEDLKSGWSLQHVGRGLFYIINYIKNYVFKFLSKYLQYLCPPYCSIFLFKKLYICVLCYDIKIFAMRKSNDTKDLIFKTAFQLFISKPYESVTVRDLEKYTEMTRGAVFYYAENKQKLFAEVMKNYFLTIQSPFTKFGHDILTQDMPLLQFINHFIECTAKVIETLASYGSIELKGKSKKANAERFYLSLVLTGGYYMKKFDKTMQEILEIDKQIWSHFLQKAINNGEIRPNIDVKLIGELFICTYRGKAFIDAQRNGLNLKELKNLFLGIYNFIKI